MEHEGAFMMGDLLTPTWANTFEDWKPQQAFHCPWCAREMETVSWTQEEELVSAWSHKDGKHCFWSELPVEVSHPFVQTLLTQIRDADLDQYARLAEFGRVLGMFRRFTLRTETSSIWHL